MYIFCFVLAMDSKEIPVPADKSVMEVKNETNRDIMYYCNQCKYSSKRKFDLERHKRLRHEPKKIDTKNNPPTKHESKHYIGGNKPISIYYCSFCDYISKRKFDVERHTHHRHDPMNDLSDDKKACFLCDDCGRSYRTKYGLTLHKKDKHTKEFKFKCSICDTGFNRLWDFRGHMNKHNASYEHCNICGITFQYKKSLAAHKKAQHSKPFSSSSP